MRGGMTKKRRSLRIREDSEQVLRILFIAKPVTDKILQRLGIVGKSIII